MFSISNLGKSFGVRVLFEGASFLFREGVRYGIVGANGSGKSTLLRIIAGDDLPTEGTLSIPQRARIGVLRQDHFHYEKVSILDTVLMGIPELWKAMEEKAAMLEQAEGAFDVDRFGELEDVIMRHDGYAVEARAAEILEGLLIPSNLHYEPLSVLSGGFKLRVLLAQTLASQPDILLLDEPTNHLDIVSIRWLEGFLQGFRGTVLVVSHDRRFINEVCTETLDVDYERITHYKGGYEAFEREKAEHRERKEREIKKREQVISDHRNFVERYRAKPSKARQAQSRLKQLDRIVIEALPPSSRQYPTFRFPACRASGKTVMECKGVAKTYDKPVLEGISLHVRRGDRVAIIGPNGIGKSTLLKILMAEVEADAGEVEWGYETHPGYFSQDHHELRGFEEETLHNWLWRACPTQPIGFVRSHLAAVLFDKEDVDRPIKGLSGGEQARLIFSRLGVVQPNVLVLDEPTNHLDLEGIEGLAEGLGLYEGTLIFVSHDRWFVAQLANRIIEITPEGIQDFRGSYSEYLQRGEGTDHLSVEEQTATKKRRKRKKR